GSAERIERYRVLVGQVQQLEQAKQKDPSEYLLKYSQPVRQAYEKMASGEPADAQAYATATLAEQRRLRVTSPKILPDDQESSLAQSFYVGNNGEELAKLLAQEQRRWGTQWPKVYGELAAKKLPAAALALGRGMAPGPAARLSAVAGTPMEELKK